MAFLARAPERRQNEIAPTNDPHSPEQALGKLAALHEEASETARLANLLGNCPRLILALPALALASVWLLGGGALWTNLLWLGFVGSAALALSAFTVQTLRRPFARLRLQRFARQTSAGLVYAGFAWGAGAYLILPADDGPLSLALFAAAPAVAVMLTLREREAVFLFLLPSGVLCAFAAVLRPFADGGLASAAVLIACAVIAGLAMVRDPRRIGVDGKAAMLSWQ